MSHAKRKSSTQHAHPVDAINSLIGVTAKGAAETLKTAASKARKKAVTKQKPTNHSSDNVEYMPASRDKNSADKQLIMDCVRYAQAIGASQKGFEADPDGGSIHATELGEPFWRHAESAIRRASRAVPSTSAGLLAKSKLAPIIFRSGQAGVTDDEGEFLISFAANVKDFLEAPEARTDQGEQASRSENPCSGEFDITARSSAETSVDLIFNLIDQCKAAMEDQDRAAMAEIPGRGAAAEASQRRLGRSFDTWRQTFKLLISTTPTSPQALRAFAEFIINVSEEWGGDDGEVVSYKEWISIMRAISRYGLDHAAEPWASPELIDRAIFERVAALKKAWARCGKGSGLSDGALDEFLEHNFERPEKELRGMRPKTIQGALAKIEFFKWDAKAAGSDDPLRRGVDAVISDLKALASRSSNRAKAGVDAIFSKVEAHDAAGALRSVAENVPSIGQLDTSDLCALFDVLCNTHDSLMAFRDGPRFEEGMGLTPGGELLSGVVDTIGFLTQEIAEQLRRKSPVEDDFDIYTEALLSWETRCGADLSSITAVIANLISQSTRIQKGRSRKSSGEGHLEKAA